MTSCGAYFVALALCFQAATALQCYSCAYSQRTNCNIGLLSSLPIEDCNEALSRDAQLLTGLSSLGSMIPTECIKLVGVDHNGKEYIARGCTVNSGVVRPCELVAKAMEFGSQDFADLNCLTCNSDLCNSATSISALGIILGIVAACLAFVF